MCPLLPGFQRVPVCGFDRQLRGAQIRTADMACGAGSASSVLFLSAVAASRTLVSGIGWSARGLAAREDTATVGVVTYAPTGIRSAKPTSPSANARTKAAPMPKFQRLRPCPDGCGRWFLLGFVWSWHRLLVQEGRIEADARLKVLEGSIELAPSLLCWRVIGRPMLPSGASTSQTGLWAPSGPKRRPAGRCRR